MADAFSDQSRDAGVPEDQQAPPASASRALVPLTTPAAQHNRWSPAFRPDARFVVHLLATASQAPQTRTLRRLAPEAAATTYSDASARDKLPVTANGAALTLVA